MAKEKMTILFKGLSALFLVVVLILSVVLVNSNASHKEAVAKLSDKVDELSKDSASIKATNEDLTNKVDTLNVLNSGLAKKNDELTKELAVKPTVVTVTAPAVETPVVDSHEVQDLMLGQVVPTFTVSQSKLKKLVDTSVNFNGDSYDMKEYLTFSNVLIAADNSDYNGVPHMELPENSIQYFVKFDSKLVTSDITNDERLDFKFLGEDVEVSSFSGNQITIVRGKEYTVAEGNSIDIAGRGLSVTFVGTNGDAVIVLDGVEKTISKGQTRDFNGVQVYAKEVMSNNRGGIVTLRLGEDVKETYQDGDDYVKNSNYVWVIDASQRKIGVSLKETYEGFNVDEEFNALSVGQSMSLPKDYAKLEFTGMDSVTYTPITMDLASKGGVEYVRIRGDFQSDVENYNRLYISKNTSDLYVLNKDNDLELVSSSRIKIADSDFELLSTVGSVKVVEVGSSVAKAEFNKDFSNAYFDTVAVSTDENSHMSLLGFKLSSIKDSSKDEKFDFSIPDQIVKATIKVI